MQRIQMKVESFSVEGKEAHNMSISNKGFGFLFEMGLMAAVKH